MSQTKTSSDKPYLLREHYTIDRAVRLFTKHGHDVEKEDIEHWLELDILKPSVLLGGQHTVVIADKGITSKKDVLKQRIFSDSEHAYTYLLEEEQYNEIPEGLRPLVFEEQEGTLRARQGYFAAKNFGVWKVEARFKNNTAFLIPARQNCNFSCLAVDYDQLPIVLETSEIEKIHHMVTTGTRLPLPEREDKSNRIDKAQEVVALYMGKPTRPHRVDTAPATMIVSQFLLHPDITIEDLKGKREVLRLIIEAKYRDAELLMPEFDDSTLDKWIGRGLPEYEKQLEKNRR